MSGKKRSSGRKRRPVSKTRGPRRPGNVVDPTGPRKQAAEERSPKKRAPRKRRKSSAETPAGATSLFTAALELPDLIALASVVRPDLGSYDPEGLAREFLGARSAPAVRRAHDGRVLSPPKGAPAGTEAFEGEPGSPHPSTPPLQRRILEELLDLPLAVLTEAAWLMRPFSDGLAAALADAEAEVREHRGAEPVNQKPYEELFTERGEAMRRIMRERRVPGKQRDQGQPRPVDSGAVDRALAPGGAVSRTLEGYEERPQQREMARAVAGSLTDGRHLMVEGGTGVGKSLAYLIPAALWARRTGRPVIVSTHTKNLQHQLFTKDLPLVREIFAEFASGGEDAGDEDAGSEKTLRVALIKGRGNYLCVRKLVRLLRTADQELVDSERVALLPVLTWAVRTETGDLSENPARGQLIRSERPASPDMKLAIKLRDKLVSSSDECRGRRCPFFGRCFLQYTRSKSLTADVVVANHALVFSELGLDTPVLPQYEEIVFDEAHHVEDVATEHLAVRCTRIGVMRILSRLFRLSSSGAGTGLLAAAFEGLSQAEDALPGEFALSANGAVSAAAQAVGPVSDRVEDFFQTASALTGGGRASKSASRSGSRAGSSAGFSAGFSAKRRYTADSREGPEWQETLSAGRALSADLVKLAALAEAAAEVFSSEAAKPVRARGEHARDLQAQADCLKKLADDLGFVLAAGDESYVYWLEEERSRTRRGPFAALTAAPVMVAPLLREQLLNRKRCVVLTSATLVVAGGFDYMASRLGLALAGPVGSTSLSGRRGEGPDSDGETDSGAEPLTQKLAVGSPFDYRKQARVYVPRFLPDPRSQAEFVAGLAPLLVELFALTRGAGLALFTSYSMLDATYEAAAPGLAARGIRALAQGRDGSRERILEELRESLGVAVFGTASFWEGVDVPGEALTALVVAKLPFHVHTEPLIQARCEALSQAGEDPFNSYTLPAAVLRLRQGFGRLIRSKRDRGIVVIADPRVLRTGYGRAFIESLPLRVQAAPTPGSLLKAARRFLEESDPSRGI